MRKSTIGIMTGIAFTFGIFLGLMIQLPVGTFPAQENEFIRDNVRDVRFKRNAQDMLNVDLKLKNNARLESLGTARKQLSLDNPLSRLKPTLHGIVYPKNNANETSVGRKTQEGFYNELHIEDKSGTAKDLQTNSKLTGGEPPAKQNVTKLADGLSAVRDTLNQFGDIFNGIFWSEQLENECAFGFSDMEIKEWKQKVETNKIVKMEEGCGRMQNRFLTFRDATHACARYRINTDQIQGEIYSFYLSRILGIYSVPPTSLSLVSPSDDRWRTVHNEIANSQWADSKVVILTKYINGLQPSYIPMEFRENDRALSPSADLLGVKPKVDLCNLLQWSDLIVFDYLTANLDRVVNNMFNRQWNHQMMNSPAHNLEMSENGKLVFLDNESGLFHGYRLLDKYAGYHKSLLESLCVFRKSTASAIERLHFAGNIGEELHELFKKNEVLNKFVPKIPKKNVQILQNRITDVYNQIKYCKTRYP